MKAVDRHLYSRNGHLYYRSAIPRALRHVLPIKENVIALRVSDKRAARVMAAQLNFAEKTLLDGLQTQLKDPISSSNTEGLIADALATYPAAKISRQD